MRNNVLFGAGMLMLFVAAPAWGNNAPQVSNVTSSQRIDGSKLVDIRYDLADADGDVCTVTVIVSDDGGSTWDVPIASFIQPSDVGGGVTPGSGKHIIWNSATDLPGAFGSQYKVRVCADDGYTFVPPNMLLIAAGEFQMGDHHDGWSQALPVHAVYVDSFYMDVYEVTNQQYADALNWASSQGLITVTSGVVYQAGGGTAYCSTTTASSYSRITWNGSTFGVVGEALPADDTGNKTNHPMVEVAWFGAAAYANWLSGMEGRTPSYNTSTWTCSFGVAGYRLPTEAEWEKAARGGQYAPYRRYPWGDTLDGTKANYWDSGDPYETGGYPRTTPAGYYDGGQTPAGIDMANGYGLYDMAGNVWEWCNDWFGPYSQCDPTPCDNPHGPATGTYRVLRGGSWGINGNFLRCATRFDGIPDYLDISNGIRLVLD